MKKKIYTIAFQTIETFYGYGLQIWKEAIKAAKNLNINLITMPARPLNAPDKYDRQNNILYNYVNQYNFDAFIMVSPLLSSFVSREKFEDFYNSLKPLLIVNIGEKISGIPSIVFDNSSGIEEMVKHLVEIHGARKIAFVRGPTSNSEANERFNAYKNALYKYNIKFDEDIVFYGDFSRYCAKKITDEIIAVNKKKKLEAIMFANDEMAISSMKLLKQLGYRIPLDFIITGFDNIEETEFEPPPYQLFCNPCMI